MKNYPINSSTTEKVLTRDKFSSALAAEDSNMPGYASLEMGVLQTTFRRGIV
jgi:hypothetical protein